MRALKSSGWCENSFDIHTVLPEFFSGVRLNDSKCRMLEREVIHVANWFVHVLWLPGHIHRSTAATSVCGAWKRDPSYTGHLCCCSILVSNFTAPYAAVSKNPVDCDCQVLSTANIREVIFPFGFPDCRAETGLKGPAKRTDFRLYFKAPVQ